MFNNLANKIETAMLDEGITRFPSFEFLLYLVSKCYGVLVNFRNAFYQKGIIKPKKLPCLVISIGNLTIGGTGKTPLTIYVGKLVRQLGFKVTLISRGYKGAAEEEGGIVSDGRSVLMEPKRAGDEPYMMAATLKDIPVVVGRKRYDAGMIAIREFEPDVVVLDDAFQHLLLARDLDLVLLDSLRPFGNGYLFPRGPLREPVSGLLRGDAFILSRSDWNDSATFERIKKMVAPRPVFKSIHIPKIIRVIGRKSDVEQEASQQPNGYDFESLRTRRIFGFSGIAKNDDFKTMLVELGLGVKGFKRFPDHHYYSEEELAMILELSRQVHCDTLVTTEKDFVRISDRTKWPVDLVVIGLETSFGDDTGGFDQFVKSRLAALIEARVSG